MGGPSAASPAAPTAPAVPAPPGGPALVSGAIPAALPTAAPSRFFYGYNGLLLWGEDLMMYQDAKKFHYRAGLAEEDEAV